jgi:FkbM family methyltransferase
MGSSYSESGEDLIASYLLSTSAGFFVDIGAGHPVVGSNTYKFYRSGWSGIGIDANKELKTSWRFLRPRDKFIPVAIGNKKGEIDFYEYENDLRSTSSSTVQEYYEHQKRKFTKTRVPQETLNSIFDEHVKGLQPIFLSIDVEGSEYDVLNSLDFSKHRPNLIAIESWELPWNSASSVVSLMKKHKYELVAYSGLTAFYMPSRDVEKLLSTRPILTNS